jgi:hypothetical protein
VERRGAARNPGEERESKSSLEGAADYVDLRDIVLTPLPGLCISFSLILGLRAALQRFTPGYCSCGASSAEQIDFFSGPDATDFHTTI